jgi:hypothetical protein
LSCSSEDLPLSRSVTSSLSVGKAMATGRTTAAGEHRAQACSSD